MKQISYSIKVFDGDRGRERYRDEQVRGWKIAPCFAARKAYGEYVVDHIPSGGRVTTVAKLRDTKKWVMFLASLPVEWDKIKTYDDVPRSVRDAVFDRREQEREPTP